MPIDPHSLPEDPQILQKIVVDLAAQLDQTQRLLQQLLAAKSGTRSEKLSDDQLRLFAQELGIELAPKAADEKDDSSDDPPPASGSRGDAKPRGRRGLSPHLKF